MNCCADVQNVSDTNLFKNYWHPHFGMVWLQPLNTFADLHSLRWINRCPFFFYLIPFFSLPVIELWAHREIQQDYYVWCKVITRDKWWIGPLSCNSALAGFVHFTYHEEILKWSVWWNVKKCFSFADRLSPFLSLLLLLRLMHATWLSSIYNM